ncbi:PREDICTED: uncharacterized protein LOC108967575 [Bactrocera latifrons]|uniref:uncharacterized protein LOC108967575 n=1 Tax=Bactrocera latifrons TaxID=174628 RepID=UPI0008DCB623|nr:PREDICTED: uncharacterized protein LOC108967575 [Bactrocera latifrons]
MRLGVGDHWTPSEVDLTSFRSFKVIFSSFPYTYNSNVIDAKVQIHNSSSEMYLSVVLQVNEELDDVYLNYSIALDLDEANYTVLANRTLNFCKFLKQHSLDSVLRNIYEDILKEGNFIKKCPIAKGLYMLREYRIDEEMLPSYVPEASFFVAMKISKANGQVLFDGKLYGKIDKSKGFNNLKMFSLG